METSTLERWVAAYVRAWESNAPDEIAALFTEDARYFTSPAADPWQGRDEIVAKWLEAKDEPGTWTFRSEILAVADGIGFVRGWATYRNPPTPYHNLWVIRFGADGRCREFTEWWMEERTGETP